MKKARFFTNIILCTFISVSSLYISDSVAKAVETTSDGTYIISDADDLKEFADNINEGNTDINAKLVNDIDLSDICSEQSGSWNPIGSDSAPYTGTFDGQGHIISGLYINSSLNYCGLFGSLDGTVQNLAVKGDVTTTSGSAGGVTGYNGDNGVIENCIFIGKTEGAIYSCGIAGENYGNGLISSCCVKMEKKELLNQYPVSTSGGRLKNCFYNEELGDDSIKRTTEVSSESFSTGELCWTINNSGGSDIWRQNIDCGIKDDFPLPSQQSEMVYKTQYCSSDDIYYSNYDMLHHNFTSEKCSDCGVSGINTDSASILLNDSIDMKYYLTVNNPEYLYDSDIILCYSYDNEPSELSVPCYKESDNTFSAVVPGNVCKINSTIFTSVKVLKSNNTVYCDTVPTEYSVLKYADSILDGSNGNYSDSCKTLILNLLRYGSEIQKYFSDDLTMENIFNEKYLSFYEEFGITDAEAGNPDLSSLYQKSEAAEASIYSVSLTVDSMISINIKVRTEQSGYSLKFTDTVTGEIRTIPLTETSESDKYYAVINNISAENLLNNFTLAVIGNNDDTVSNTIGYNIEKYIYAVNNSGNTQINKASDICTALLGYAKSVKNYCDSLN